MFEFPLSIKDYIQEDARAGQQNGVDHTLYWYCICISLELFIGILRRILTTTANGKKYKATLVSDLYIALSFWFCQFTGYDPYLHTNQQTH